MTGMRKADFDARVDIYLVRWSASSISGRRSVKHSIAVGGFKGDPHTAGFAVDVEYDEVPDIDTVHEYAQTLGLIVLREHHANGDHLQPADWVNDG